MPTRRQQAAAELLKRRRAADDLLEFTQLTHGSFRPSWHHVEICRTLERVERGELDRVMIFMPPRHGKSELASKRFPAWYMGRNPTRQIIACSYGTNLAVQFGRQVRNIVGSEEYQNVFEGVSLAKDSRARGMWHTNHGGVYLARGVGAGITGSGAHLALVDDVFKGRAEADSAKRRETIHEWYLAELYNRIMPTMDASGGAIVVIMTRWHQDDLAGRLLDEMKQDGDQWHVLSLPAIANENTENEKALWPEWYPLKRLHRIRKTYTVANNAREWNSLFQQNPTAEEGTYFQRSWLRWYDAKPKHLHIYGASDFAVKDGGGDFTEHGVFGIDEHDDIYVLDWWYGHTSSDVWVSRMVDLWEQWKPLAWFGEAGVIQHAVQPIISREEEDREVYCRTEWVPSIDDKPTRARAIQSRFARSKVYLPKGKGWATRFVEEQYVPFPAGKFDDGVDVFSSFGLALESAHPAIVRLKPATKKRDRWGDPYEERKGRGWKTA